MDAFLQVMRAYELQISLEARGRFPGSFSYEDAPTSWPPFYGRVLLAVANGLIAAGQYLRCVAQSTQPLSHTHA